MTCHIEFAKKRVSLSFIFAKIFLLTLVLIAGSYIFFSQSPADVHALNNGLALTPPMGWNPYNYWYLHQSTVSMNEAFIKENADALLSSGMLAAGYQYVNLDGGWYSSARDGNGNIQPDSGLYPNGIKALADYVHGKCANTSNGTICEKLGLYGQPTFSYGHEQQDANTFASWGVDYYKYDYFFSTDSNAGNSAQQYALMRDALLHNSSGRPIAFSVNAASVPWVNDPSGPWRPGVANIWRTTSDIFNGNNNFNSIKDILNNNNQSGNDAATYAGPGRWNDPDMLEVGNGMSTTEDQAHFSMWAMMAAPLIAGTDLSTISDSTKNIFTNSEVIAVDQDAGGYQGVKVSDSSGAQVWSKPLKNGAFAVALLNMNDSATTITANWSDVGLTAGNATVRDLWQHQDLGSFSGSYTASNVPSHGVVMLTVKPQGIEAEASNNTLAGDARTIGCGGCSGGTRVGYLGGNGTLTINNVNAPSSGTYTLTIAYTNGDNSRTAYISSNGGTATAFTFPGTGGWDNVGTYIVPITLQSGQNTITFANSSGWAPDIDHIQVTKSPYIRSYEAEFTAADTTVANGARVSSCSNCSNGNKVGYLGVGSTLTFNQINVPNNGIYQVTISYTNGDFSNRNASISANGGGAISVSFAGTGDWNGVGTTVINLPLNAGNNTLTFSNSTGWMPDIDRLQV